VRVKDRISGEGRVKIEERVGGVNRRKGDRSGGKGEGGMGGGECGRTERGEGVRDERGWGYGGREAKDAVGQVERA